MQALLPLALLGILVCGASIAWRRKEISERRGHLLELTLVALFFLVPSVAEDIFASFACESFGYDDANATNTAAFDASERYFLRADFSIRCSYGSYSDPQYETIRTLALIFVALWPVGVPVLFLAVVHASQHHDVRRIASGFLTREYTTEFYWWEVLLLLKKLALTGFLFLVPQDLVFLRLVAALLVCITYLVLLLHAKPYRSPTTAMVAVGINVTLVFLFLTAVLIQIANVATPHQRFDLFGPVDIFWLTVTLLLFNLAVVVCAIALVLQQVRSALHQAQCSWVRYTDGEEVRLSLATGLEYHLFLSHSWATGQDQMRIIKERLNMLLPGTRVFLDVDEDGSAISSGSHLHSPRKLNLADLESIVATSAAVLVFCSRGYFQSKNCLREVCF